VADTRNVRVQKFDAEGNFLTLWGSLGCKDDQFLIPHDIAMDSEGTIYVTDSGKSHFRADYDCNSQSNHQNPRIDLDEQQLPTNLDEEEEQQQQRDIL